MALALLCLISQTPQFNRHPATSVCGCGGGVGSVGNGIDDRVSTTPMLLSPYGLLPSETRDRPTCFVKGHEVDPRV